MSPHEENAILKQDIFTYKERLSGLRERISSIESKNESLENTITQLQQALRERNEAELDMIRQLSQKDSAIINLVQAFQDKLRSDSVG